MSLHRDDSDEDSKSGETKTNKSKANGTSKHNDAEEEEEDLHNTHITSAYPASMYIDQKGSKVYHCIVQDLIDTLQEKSGNRVPVRMT
jgi:hypothetical protein